MKLRKVPPGWGEPLQPPPGYFGFDGSVPDEVQRPLILDWAANQRIASGWRWSPARRHRPSWSAASR